MILSHHTTGRSVKALVALALIWGGLALIWWQLQASPIIVGAGYALTLPAVWEFATAKPSGLTLEEDQIHWYSGRHRADVALRMIKHVRFDTRLDLSVRVTVHLHSGRKLRIAQDALTRPDALKSALEQAGIRTETHHFALFG